MMAIKVTLARVPAARLVESIYALQGRNREREKHQVENGARRKVGDMSTKTRHHSIGGDRRMSKDLVNPRDKVG